MLSYLVAVFAVLVGNIENGARSLCKARNVYNPGPFHFTPMNLPNGAFSPNYKRPVIVAAEKSSEYNPGLPETDMSVSNSLMKMKVGLDIINNSPFLGKIEQKREVI